MGVWSLGGSSQGHGGIYLEPPFLFLFPPIIIIILWGMENWLCFRNINGRGSLLCGFCFLTFIAFQFFITYHSKSTSFFLLSISWNLKFYRRFKWSLSRWAFYSSFFELNMSSYIYQGCLKVESSGSFMCNYILAS